MKIAIGVPCGSGLSRIETTLSIAASVRDLSKKGYEVEIFGAGDSWVAGLRNEICKESLALGVDWIAMTDTDMSFSGDLFDLLIQNNVDICVPLMHKRHPPFVPVIYDRLEADETKAEFQDRWQSRFHLKKGLTECDGVGSGVIMIRASILNAMAKPWFASGERSGLLFGEDLYFCNNAKKHGFKVYYDGRLMASHFGQPWEVRTDWVLQQPGCPYTLTEV